MLKKSISKFVVAASLIPAFSMAAPSVEDRLSELEANSSLNIFSFGGLLETRYDALDAKQTTFGSNTAFDNHVDYLRMKFSFNADAAVSPYIKVYTRSTMSKYANVGRATRPNTSNVNVTDDLYVAKNEKGAQLIVEKAYADLLIPDSGFVFSFGRLSTSDGPPFNWLHGRPRMGTYPGLLYNAQLDGLALSYNKQMEGASFAARLVYTPFSSYVNTLGTVGGNGQIVPPTESGTNKGSTLSDLTSFMLEYSNNSISFADRMTVIAQGWQTGRVGLAGADISGIASGSTTFGSGYFEYKIGAQAIHLDMENIMNSGFDFAVTALSSTVNNYGSLTLPAALGGTVIYGQGATAEGETKSGSSMLLSARYRISNTFLGAEYLAGGKSAFVYDNNNDTISSFYSTTGTGTHAYVLHKFNGNLGLRFGYMKQEYKSTPFQLGAQKDSDRTINTYYANLRLDF